MSQKRGFKPARTTASAVAIKVKAGTITSVSLSQPSMCFIAVKMSVKASNPLPTPMQWRAPRKEAKRVSNCRTASPFK